MKAIISILKNDTDVAAQTGSSPSRIFPNYREENSGLPAVTVTLTDSDPNATKSGRSSRDHTTVQVISYASTYEAANTLAEDCRNALDRKGQGVFNTQGIENIYLLDRFEDYERINNNIVHYIEQNYRVSYKTLSNELSTLKTIWETYLGLGFQVTFATEWGNIAPSGSTGKEYFLSTAKARLNARNNKASRLSDVIIYPVNSDVVYQDVTAMFDENTNIATFTFTNYDFYDGSTEKQIFVRALKIDGTVTGSNLNLTDFGTLEQTKDLTTLISTVGGIDVIYMFSFHLTNDGGHSNWFLCDQYLK